VLAAIAGIALLATSSGTGAAEQRKRGGTLKLISSGDTDSVDPGQTYYVYGYHILSSVHRPLYYVPADSVKTVPDLAAGQPKISADGKTVTLQIRRGVRFGPPVNREVTAADVKYAIERSFSSSVPNGYVNLYFADLVGVPEKPPKTPKPVAGIQTPSSHTLVFKLKVPSTTLVGALVMFNTAPVPKEYAAKYDNKTTSEYPFHQVATGPYMFEADASGNIKGKGYTPGKRMRLVRNPNWSPRTDFRPAYLDRIDVNQGFTDSTVGARQILNGRADAASDYTILPPAIIKEATTDPRYEDNFYTTPTGTAYIVLNTAKKPFDNLNVRRAANYVLDKNALRLAQGGAVTGRIATHFIGPEFKSKGFEAAGGFGYDPFRSRNYAGDVEKAKAEMRRAGYANGLYSGPAVTAIAANASPSPQHAKIVAASFAKIGIKVNIRLASIDALFTKFCVVPKNQPELCTSVGWFPDFKDPVTMLDPTFNGKSINPSYNVNMAQLNDPKINAAMERAKRIKNPTARYAAWGKIDKDDHGAGRRDSLALVEHAEPHLRPGQSRQELEYRRPARPVLHVARVGPRRLRRLPRARLTRRQFGSGAPCPQGSRRRSFGTWCGAWRGARCSSSSCRSSRSSSSTCCRRRIRPFSAQAGTRTRS
jgi:peptide/nickel transport system substrate-binding protein